MRKPVVYIALVILMLVIIVSGFIFLKNQKKFDTNALKAVPINSECIFRIHSLRDIHSVIIAKEDMFKELNESKIFESFERVYSLVDSLVELKDLDFDIDKSVTCATKLVGKNKIDILYIVELENNNELKAIMKIARDCLPKYTLRKKSYSGEEIYMYTNKNERYNIACLDGLLLISPSVIFLEEAIRQTKSDDNLLSLSSFVSVNKTLDKSADINLYINNANIKALTKLWAESSYFTFLNKINKWGKWTALDVDLDKDNISFNGFSCSSHNDFDLFNVLSNQQSVEFSLLDAVPANTATFSLLALSNTSKYREDMIKYRGKISTLNKYRRGIKELEKRFSSKFENKFFSFFSGEAICLSMSINSLKVNANKVSVFNSIGEEKLRTEMMDMLSSLAEKEKASISSYRTTVKIDREISYKIYKMPFSDIAYRLMGDIFYQAPTNYFTIFGNNLVFGGSVKILTEYLRAMSLNKSILDDSSFESTNKRLSDKCNFLFYANTNSAMPLIKSYFNQKRRGLINKYKDGFSKFHSVGYQLASANSMVYNNLFVLYTEKLEHKPQTDWESGIDGNIVMKPAIVKNHTSGETEIFVQDDKDNVYLINSLGRILWKLPIDGRINSEIFQVDALRNKKLQYLFSTSKKMYLIDRNGNNVGSFPVKLKSQTKQGLSVFDYDKNRKYRIAVPSVNRKVYLYDIKGNIIKGWKFKKAENAISSRVYHKRIGKKDYIVFKDKFKMYILNRRGRQTAKSKYIKLSDNDIVFVKSKKAHMLVTGLDASVYKIDFKGKINKLMTFNDISKNHLFTATDLDNDGKQDFIFADANKLYAYSGKKKIIDMEFSGEIRETPSIYSFSRTKKMIGIIDSESHKAYLLDKNANNYPGFPVLGDTPFSITFMSGKTSGFYMFVGSQDSSLYKYQVQK
jgi:hypothetical protein